MRWSTYLTALTPEQQQDVLNALTLGSGRIALAAQWFSRSGETAELLRLLDTARSSFGHCADLLAVTMAATLIPVAGAGREPCPQGLSVILVNASRAGGGPRVAGSGCGGQPRYSERPGPVAG